MAVSIGPKIGIEGESEYRKQINNIIQETKTLKSEYESVTAAFDKGKQSLEQNKEMHRILGEEISAQKDRVEQLKDMVQKASDKFGEADPKTQRWKEALYNANGELAKMQEDLKNLPSDIKLIGEKMKAAADKIKDAGKKIQDWGRNLAPLSAVATGVLAGSGKAFIDFETAMTGVRKTVDGTEEDFQELGSWIKQASTEMASSKEDIAGTMEIAGQLGVSGVQNLEEFTKTMVMLGDTTNLSSEEAATALARFMNITGTSYEDTSRLGSVIVDLGNNFATSESEITKMATRLASAGTVAGLSETDILALSAAMSSVGINAEAGGTAMTQTLNAIDKAVDGIGKGASEKLETMANIAGMTADQFTQAWKTEPIEAISAFIAGLGNLKEEDESTIATLNNLGMSGVRQSNMLQSLALASDLLNGAVVKSNEAWDKNVALQDEAEKKYNTTAAQIQQTKEKITNVALEIGERMLPYLDKILATVDDLITRWDKLDEGQKDAIFVGIAGLAALAPALTAIGGTIQGIGAIASAVTAVLSGGIATVVAGIAGAVLAVGAFIDMWQNGWSVISTVLEAIGIAIVAVAAVAAGAGVAIAATVAAVVFGVTQAIILIHDNWDTITEGMKKTWDEFAQSCKVLWDDMCAAFKMAGDGLSKWWNDLCNSWKQRWNALCNAVRSTWNSVTNTLSGYFNTLQTRFSNTVNGLQRSFTDFVSKATSWGRDLMDNFIDGINSMWNRLVDTVSDIADTIADYLGFSEPDKGPLSNFHTYAPDMMKLFAKGIKDNENVVQSQIERSFDFSGLATEAFTTHATPYAYMPDTTTNNSVSIGSTQIVINATEGQSVYEIADAVDEIINQRYQRAQAAWA